MVKGVTCCDEPINKYHPTQQFSALWSILLSPCSSIWINGPLFYCFGLISQPWPAAAALAHYTSLTGWLAISENYQNTWRYRHNLPECSRHTLKTSRFPPLLFICKWQWTGFTPRTQAMPEFLVEFLDSYLWQILKPSHYHLENTLRIQGLMPQHDLEKLSTSLTPRKWIASLQSEGKKKKIAPASFFISKHWF